MSERQEVPFTNDLGQTIQVGDEVVVVTMCTKSVYTNRGKYIGLRNGNVQAELALEMNVLVDKETREQVNIWKILEEEGVGYPYRIRYGTPEYKEALERYNTRRQEIMAKCEYEKRPYTRVTTLQRNRIYKLAV